MYLILCDIHIYVNIKKVPTLPYNQNNKHSFLTWWHPLKHYFFIKISKHTIINCHSTKSISFVNLKSLSVSYKALKNVRCLVKKMQKANITINCLYWNWSSMNVYLYCFSVWKLMRMKMKNYMKLRFVQFHLSGIQIVFIVVVI